MRESFSLFWSFIPLDIKALDANQPTRHVWQEGVQTLCKGVQTSPRSTGSCAANATVGAKTATYMTQGPKDEQIHAVSGEASEEAKVESVGCFTPSRFLHDSNMTSQKL